MNTERYSWFLCIQSEYGKIRTRKTPNTDTFYEVEKQTPKTNNNNKQTKASTTIVDFQYLRVKDVE